MINSLKLNKKWLVLLIALLLFNVKIFSQFEQKLTINVSAAYIVPDITSLEAVYNSGFGGDGGIQFNINKYLSLIANGRFYYIFGNEDHSAAYIENLAFGGGLKVNFAPRSVVNPYIFTEVNMNFLWFEDYRYFDEPYYDGVNFIPGIFIEDSGFGFGVLGGGGVDFKIGESIAIYLQPGGYYTHYDSKLHIYTQAGVRINLLKSKTI